MSRYHDPNTRFDRANAIVWVAAVHLVLAATLAAGSRVKVAPVVPPPPRLIDIATLDIPPPPPPPRQPAPDRDPGTAGKRAVAAPVVVPSPRVKIEAPSPLRTARSPGTGVASTAGAASAGNGPGAGASGGGRGGGGPGGRGVAISEDAQLLWGGLNRRDYAMLRSFAAPGGRAVVALLVGQQGRVLQCTIRQSSGDGALDQRLCATLAPRMRWAPARDRYGNPLAVGIDYTAVWSRY